MKKTLVITAKPKKTLTLTKKSTFKGNPRGRNIAYGK